MIYIYIYIYIYIPVSVPEEGVPDFARIQRITKREGACGIVSRSYRSASKAACIVPILSDDPQPSRSYRSASRVHKNSPLNHVNTIRIMSFCTLKLSSVTEALRRALHQRYITIYLRCFTKKNSFKSF